MSVRAPAYGEQVGLALAEAARIHAAQTRKGKDEPYLTHLLRVTQLVIRFGGGEAAMIAAALHDAPEDHGGEELLQEVAVRFGEEVAGIIRDCSDSLTTSPESKADWRPRKLAHLQHLADGIARPSALVMACDKMANLEDLLEDLQQDGEPTLRRFRGGAAGTRAYYVAAYRLLSGCLPYAAAARFKDLVETFCGPGSTRPVDEPIAAFAEATATAADRVRDGRES